MEESKILITNYPRMRQYCTFEDVNDNSRTLNVISGYDIKVNNYEVTLQIARDLITALLTFDKIYIEGGHIWDILQVFGSDYIKELLILRLLCIIPDQELNPVIMKECDGEWRHDLFPYAQMHTTKEDVTAVTDCTINIWSHIENTFSRYNFIGQEANTILYLIDENSADIGNITDIKEKINNETNKDLKNPEFILDPVFFRKHPDSIYEYNHISGVRLHELNKSAILAAVLNIDNIKMDAAINEIMIKKTASAFSKDIHSGTDAFISIEQQKGFPDLGELFVNKIIDLDDILKLRDNFHGKIFRYWVKKSDYEEQQMRQEIMNSVHNILGSKCLNPLRMLACNLIGIAGFIPSLAATAFDSYILDTILKGWHPNFFLDDKLKKMIDSSIVKEETEIKRQKLEKSFKDVGRNDPCPCGSGKKFKKCHGKSL